MTRPDDIPEDVWGAATDIEIDADFSWDGQSSDGRKAHWEARIEIARAILAERERCAKIADFGVKWTPPLQRGNQLLVDESCGRIAAAIRAGGQ